MNNQVAATANLLDSWRLALGTLTALRVSPPRHVSRNTAKNAMLLAPVAALPLGLAVTGIGLIGQALGLAAVVTAFLAVGGLALLSRCFHLDGLSDTADGLTASYDRARSLEVMKGGTAGPAGVVALVVVIGLQTGALTALLTTPSGAVLAGLCVIASRAALVLCCLRAIPSARPGGLGDVYAGSVPWSGAALVWLLGTVTLATGCGWDHVQWWRGVVAVVVALVVVAMLLRRVHQRLGGVTGDVFGAGVELALTTLVVALT
jgi:adenosylcobinamide-GDP ribazoletransferase